MDTKQADDLAWVCADCGIFMRWITAAEAQEMARRGDPNLPIHCPPCRDRREHEPPTEVRGWR